jgi:hypothetical protein
VKNPKPQKMLAGALILLSLTLSLSGCGKGSGKNIKIPGVDGPRVAFVDNKMTLWVVFQALQLDLGARFQIPHAENSFIEVGPDLQSNGTLFSIALDIADIKRLSNNSVNLLDPLTLPGGRPLPGITEGYLPGVAVQVPRWKDITFYFGGQVFGAFLPVRMGIQDIVATYRFYSDSGVRIGNLSLIGQDSSGANSGFLLLIDLSGAVGKLVASARI